MVPHLPHHIPSGFNCIEIHSITIQSQDQHSLTIKDKKSQPHPYYQRT